MCGRTACTLDKYGVQRATCQYSRNKEKLQWIEKYSWQNYQPNYNLSPSQISPVLVDGSVFPSEVSNDNYVITSMRWGLIPSWHKGTLQDFHLKTNNCRLESILERPIYKGAVTTGRRCIILADGFYEWKIIDTKKKQPYFIYFPQEQGLDVFTQSRDNMDEDEWQGPQLLTMAGLFDTWKNPNEDIIYSYSVITMDSSNMMSFVHERMPAILTEKDEISMWLDTNRVPTKEAIAILKPVENLQMHPVSSLVNNSRNNSIDCVKPFKKQESKPAFKHTALTSWLRGGSKESPAAKRIKLDS